VDVGFVARHPLLVSRSNRVNSGIERKAAKLGLSLNILMDVQALHLVIDLVCRGVAYTMVPYSAISRELAAGHVCAAPIVGIQTGWVVAWPRDRKVSIATLRLVDAVKAEFDEAHAAMAFPIESREEVSRRGARAKATSSRKN
jgi:LysR family nitrogen assimilation transcriptional regulator